MEQTKKLLLSELSTEIGPKIPEFLRKIYRFHGTLSLREDDVIIVSDMDYFKKLEEVLGDFPSDVIRNYMAWRILQTFGYLASADHRVHELEFKKEQTGIQKLQNMDRRCLDLLSDTTPDLVGRTYVDNFFTLSDKEIANAMIRQVLKRFKEIVKQKEWMDERTQTNSMAKAGKISVNTGFPDWLLHDKKLQHEYDFVSLGETCLLSCLTHALITGGLRGREYHQFTPQNVPHPHEEGFRQIEEKSGWGQRMADGSSDSQCCLRSYPKLHQ